MLNHNVPAISTIPFSGFLSNATQAQNTKHKLNETKQLLDHHKHMKTFRNENYSYPLPEASIHYLNQQTNKQKQRKIDAFMFNVNQPFRLLFFLSWKLWPKKEKKIDLGCFETRPAIRKQRIEMVESENNGRRTNVDN